MSLTVKMTSVQAPGSRTIGAKQACGRQRFGARRRKAVVMRHAPVASQQAVDLGNSASSAALGLAASVSLAVGFCSMPAEAYGPQSVPLEVSSYSMIPCPEGVSKDTKCIDVAADADLPASKSAFNSEVFGRVRFKTTGESALYGDFAEASDAGKMADIAGEIKPGKNTVHFLVRLSKEFTEDDALDFVSLKARTYPGMRQDFRVMKPVSATEDCPEAELGEPCEDIPF